MRKTLVIIVLLVLAAVRVFGQWHWDVRISETDSASLTSRSGGWGIGANEEDVHITWFDKTFSYSTVRYWRFPIESPAMFAFGVAINSDFGCDPVLSVSDTNAHIDWCVGSLYFREIVGMAMSPILEHGWPGTSNLYPAIADDASGNTHCVFSYSDDSLGLCLAYQRRTAGGDFSPPVEIIGPPPGSYGAAYYPTICIGPDGNIHAAWIQSWKGNIGYGTSVDGSNWTVSEIPRTSCDPYAAPSICCNKSGTVYVAFVSTNDAIHVRKRSGTTWSSDTINVSGPGMICGGPSIYAATTSACVAWHARFSEEASNEIYYSAGGIYWNPSNPCWLYRQWLTSSDSYESQYPNIIADPNGNVHIIWSDSCDGNFEIYYNWSGGVRQGRDLAVTCIRQPVGRISKDSIPPLARIGNFGEAKDSCYANCKITGPGSNYNKNNWFGTEIIPSGGEVITAFPLWTPPGNVGDAYEVKVTVYFLPEKTIADYRVDSCVIRGVAVTATTILEPQEGDTLEHLTPAAYFTNTGTEPAANFYCHCDITSAGFHSDDYADSVLVANNLAVDDSIFIGFDDYGCEENCSYVATFHATSATEDTIYSPHIQVHFHGTYTGVAESAEVLRIELAGTNPFRAPPWISYSIGVPTEVSIRVYDVSGKLVEILHDGELSGRGRLHWNEKDTEGRMLANGLYFVRILTPQFDRTHKIVLVR